MCRPAGSSYKGPDPICHGCILADSWRKAWPAECKTLQVQAQRLCPVKSLLLMTLPGRRALVDMRVKVPFPMDSPCLVPVFVLLRIVPGGKPAFSGSVPSSDCWPSSICPLSFYAGAALCSHAAALELCPTTWLCCYVRAFP